MKLCFSTVCCPGWSFDEIYAAAKDFGFDGIELSRIGDADDVINDRNFLPANLEATANKLKGTLELPMLTTSVCIDDDIAEATQKLLPYIELAKALRIPNIRVVTRNATTSAEFNTKRSAKTYGELCDLADKNGISLLLETVGVFSNTEKLRAFLDSIDSCAKGVLWDLNYPCQLMGESPAETYRNIGKFVKMLHIKDSTVENGKITYKLMGRGELPVRTILHLLDLEGYDGFASFEWQRRWNSDFDEPGIALAQYVSYMRRLLKNL